MNDSHSALRFALLGYGPVGVRHARAIEQCSAAELAGIAVVSPKLQDEARRAHCGAEVVGETDELLARGDIDVVDIVVPSHLRYAAVKAALEAGKHVLLEKPMALDADQCDELVQIAEQRGRVLSVVHELRWSPLWGEVKRLIERGVVGRVQHVVVELMRPAYRQGTEGWREERSINESWLMEEPLDFFDLAQWYLESSGPAVSVYARANARRPTLPGLHDNFTALITFPGETYAVISQTLSAVGHRQSLHIVGTEGTIRATSRTTHPTTPPTLTLNYSTSNDAHELEFTPSLNTLQSHLTTLCHSLLNDLPPPCPAHSTRHSTHLALAAERSIQSNTPSPSPNPRPPSQPSHQG